ncbi:MAG: hypothetical protein RLY43_2051 [Bacteroidota bacterium]|jgi:hypothetical protein
MKKEKPTKQLEIKWVDINSVLPAKYNPREISESALNGLIESIKRFGFVDPIIVNNRTNSICGGHMRVRAAEFLGFKSVPVVYVDLSLTEEKALNVTLNNDKITGHFTDKLQDLLQEIKLELDAVDFSGLKLDTLELKFDDFEPKLPEENEDLPEEKLILIVTLPNQDEKQTLFDELNSRGYKVK